MKLQEIRETIIDWFIVALENTQSWPSTTKSKFLSAPDLIQKSFRNYRLRVSFSKGKRKFQQDFLERISIRQDKLYKLLNKHSSRGDNSF